MIVRWKKRDDVSHVAEWQGMSLSIKFEPAVNRPPWRIYVDSVLVTVDNGRPANYWTCVAAMEAVDAAVNRRVIAMGATVQASQRTASVGRIVRHG